MKQCACITLLMALILTLSRPVPAADMASQLGECDAAYARFDLSRSHAAAAQAHGGSPESFEAAWRLVRGEVDLGEEAQDAGDDKVAESWYNKALKSSKELVARHPTQSMAHYYRALALGRRALFAGSKEAVQLSQEIEREALKAIELDPRNGRAHGLIGRYYREMAHLSWVRRKLAETLFGDLPEGGDEKALAHLAKATSLEPDWIFAWLELGETQEVMGKSAEARKSFQKAAGMVKKDHRDDRLKAEAKKRLG